MLTNGICNEAKIEAEHEATFKRKRYVHVSNKRGAIVDNDLRDPSDSKKFRKHVFYFTESQMPSFVGCTVILSATKKEKTKLDTCFLMSLIKKCILLS